MISAEEPVEFTRKLRDIEVTEKETAVFKCEMSKPDLEAIWLHNGQSVSVEDGFDIKIEKTIHSLVLEDVSVEDAGIYSIKVGDKISEGRLSVKGKFSWL